MSAQREHAPHNWPDDWNVEGSLFADATEFKDAATTWSLDLQPSPVEASELSPTLIGFRSNQLGYAAEQAVDARVAELGGYSDKPSADDQPYDRLIRFGDDKPKTAQIKYATVKDGKARFTIGPRVGYHDSKVERRRTLPSRSRADVFILVTFWKDAPRFYIIPAARLDDKVSLTVTPGRRRSRRLAWKAIEPEDYVEAWNYCSESKTRADLMSIYV